MRVESVSRPDFPSVQPPRQAACGVRPNCSSAPACAAPPPYDVYIASDAVQKEIDRPVYSDVLAARREALRRAAAIAKDDLFQPITFPGMPAPTDAPRAHEPRRSADDPAPATPRPTPRIAEFRRAVQTLDNRGSLIDLLL